MIHFQRDSNGTPRFILVFLIILAVAIVLSSLLFCRFSFAEEPYRHQGPGPRPAHLSRIEGVWLADINNRPGRLEFHWTGNAWTGRIWMDTLGRWEELTDVFIDPRTGQVQFHRPYGDQRYYGTLSGERIEGTFGVGGPGNFPWAAWRH